MSRVSAPLSARWSPERRKALSWEMLRRVRPKAGGLAVWDGIQSFVVLDG